MNSHAPDQAAPAKIGIYGGSFDPVHLAHLLVAIAAREEAGLDRVYFVPASQSPFKPGRQLTPGPIRCQLLRLALAGQTFCEVDPSELERGGVSFTIDTVRDYRRRHPAAQLHWLIGADHVPLLPKWRDAAELAASVEFLVIPRPGEGEKPLPEGFRGRWLQGFPLGVSSSQIRDRAARRLPIAPLVGAAVAEAIENYRLYL